MRTRMLLLVVSCLALLLFLAASPAAAQRPVPTPAGGSTEAYPLRRQVIVFEDSDPFQLTAARPETMLIDGQGSGKKPGSLIPVRRHFLDKMMAAAENL